MMGVKSKSDKAAGPHILFIHEQATTLPLVMAVMGFLATLALVGGIALGKLAEDWRTGLEGTLTVEISVEAAESYRAETGNNVTPEVVKLLEANPAIGAATPLTDEAIAALLAPWFPDADTVNALPLPQLIDVKLLNDPVLDIIALNNQLAQIHPEIRADDYQAQIADQVRLAGRLSWLGIGLIGLVTFATAMIIGFATRSSFDAHRPTVELMHLIGTSDKKVIGMFGRHFMTHALSGSVFGMGIGLLLLVIMARGTNISISSIWQGLGPSGLTATLLMPVIIGVLALFMARREVRNQLAQMV